MRRFGWLGVFFERINQRPANGNWLQFVSLFVSFPCFKASNFFFSISYRLNQRRALVLQRKQRVLGINDFPLEFYLHGPTEIAT